MGNEKLVLELIADLTKLDSGLDGGASRIQGWAKKVPNLLGAALKAFAALGAAAAAVGAGITALVVTTSNAGDEIAKLAKRTGMSVKFLSEMTYVLDLNDASMSDLALAARGMARQLLAADEEALEAQRALKGLGLELADLKAMRPDEMFMAVLRALAKVDSATMRAAYAQRILGRGAEALLPTILDLAQGFEKSQREARRFGLVWSPKEVLHAEEFNDASTRVKSSLLGLVYTFGRQLLPVGGRALNWLANRIARFQPIARRAGREVAQAVERMFRLLRRHADEAERAVVRSFWAMERAAALLIRALVALTRAFEALARSAIRSAQWIEARWQPLMRWLRRQFAWLDRWIRHHPQQWAEVKRYVMAAVTAVVAFRAALIAAAMATTGLGAITNPWLAIPAAIGAVIYALYRYSDEVRAWLQDLWRTIQSWLPFEPLFTFRVWLMGWFRVIRLRLSRLWVLLKAILRQMMDLIGRAWVVLKDLWRGLELDFHQIHRWLEALSRTLYDWTAAALARVAGFLGWLRGEWDGFVAWFFASPIWATMKVIWNDIVRFSRMAWTEMVAIAKLWWGNLAWFVGAVYATIIARTQQAGQWIALHWQQVVAFIRQAWETFAPVVGAALQLIIRAWKTVLEDGRKAWQAMWPSIDAALREFMAWFLQQLERIMAWWGENKDMIRENYLMLVGVVGFIIKAIYEIARLWLQMLWPIIQAFFRGFWALFTWLFEFVTNTLGVAARILNQILQGDVVGAWETLFKHLIEWFGRAGKAIWEVLEGAAILFWKWLTGLWDEVWQWLLGKFDVLLEKVKDIWGKIKTALDFSTKGSPSMYDVFARGLGNVEDMFATAGATAGEAFRNSAYPDLGAMTGGVRAAGAPAPAAPASIQISMPVTVHGGVIDRRFLETEFAPQLIPILERAIYKGLMQIRTPR